MTKQEALFEYCLRLGDDSLILGHRLGEWCGVGPILEEDIALTNVALDLIGQATSILNYAAQVENKDRDADALAYLRTDVQYKNRLLCEQSNGDFAVTILRQFFYSAFYYHFYNELKNSNDRQLVAIAEKSIKEVTYHLRHSGEWVIRLGDGTEESKQRLEAALTTLWRFTGEFFEMNEVDEILIAQGIAVDVKSIKPKWEATIIEVFGKATLEIPTAGIYMATGSQKGMHSEHLGYILAEMQSVPRAYPEAKW